MCSSFTGTIIVFNRVYIIFYFTCNSKHKTHEISRLNSNPTKFAFPVDSEDDVLLVEDRSADEVREAKKRKLGVVDLSGSSAGAGAGGTRSVVVIE